MKGLALLPVLLALAGAAFAATPSAPSPGRTVPCKEIILGTKWPFIGSRQPEHRYRIVLGAVSVPPAYMPEVEGPEPGNVAVLEEERPRRERRRGSGHDQRRPGHARPRRDRVGKRPAMGRSTRSGSRAAPTARVATPMQAASPSAPRPRACR